MGQSLVLAVLTELEREGSECAALLGYAAMMALD